MKQLKIKQKYWFLSIFLGMLGASLLGNLLSGEKGKAKRVANGIIRAGSGLTWAGDRTVRIFNAIYSLTNFGT